MKTLADLPKAGDLPSPGPVALRLVQLASREDATAAELARTLQADPALAGRVLKLANSAALGGSRGVASVAQAVVRLGFRSVRQVALGLSLIDSARKGRCEGFDYPRFWTHSLASGVAAERLARENRIAAADDCFTVGLLHDVGSLGLAAMYPAEYSLLLNQCGGDEAMLREAESAAFGLCHRELTVLMLRNWGVPEPFGGALLARNAPGRASPREGALAVFFDLAIEAAAWCVSTGADPAEPPSALARRVEDIAGEPVAILDEIRRTWCNWAREFRLPERVAAAAA